THALGYGEILTNQNIAEGHELTREFKRKSPDSRTPLRQIGLLRIAVWWTTCVHRETGSLRKERKGPTKNSEKFGKVGQAHASRISQQRSQGRRPNATFFLVCATAETEGHVDSLGYGLIIDGNL